MLPGAPGATETAEAGLAEPLPREVERREKPRPRGRKRDVPEECKEETGPPPRGRAAKRKSRSNPTSYLPSSEINRDIRVDRWNELTTEQIGAIARDPGDCPAVEICAKIQSYKRS